MTTPKRKQACASPGCRAWFLTSCKWDNIRAGNDGWTGLKNGQWLCPVHMPEWKRRKMNTSYPPG